MIVDPMTMLTDYLLGTLTLVLSLFLFREWQRGRQQAVRWWALAFLAITIATYAGGTYHGFVKRFDPITLSILWRTTTFSVGVASFCLLAAIAHACLSQRGRVVLLVAASVKLALYLFWMSSHDDFSYVIADYGLSMIIILAFSVGHWSRPGFRWIVAGIAVSFAAAGIQQARLGFGPDFNHDAVYHVVQMAGMALLYRGGRDLRDRSQDRVLAGAAAV